MENQNTEDKKRGGCLTTFIWVFIVLYALGSLGSLVLMNSPLMQKAGQPGWYSIISSIFSLIAIIGLVAILKWKKVGVYLFVIAMLLAFIFSVIISKSLVITLVGGVVSDAIVLGIFYYVIKPVWKYLE